MKSLLIVLFFAPACLIPLPARAVHSEPAPKLCNVYFTADMIAHVHIVKATEIFDRKNDFLEGYRYKVKVVKAYLGKPARLITVESDNSQSRLILKTGKDYVLFAKHGPSKDVYLAWAHGDGIQSVNGQPFSQTIVDNLVQLRDAKLATIEGEIRGKAMELAPNLSFAIWGEGQRFEVTTDGHGQFAQALQPGTYRVELPPELRESSYSFYDLPQKPIHLRAGQCAQIQLQQK